MGFLDAMDIEEGQAPTTVPGGAEYQLRITGVREDDSYDDQMPRDKNGNPYLMPKFEIMGEPTAKEFTRYLAIPHDEMDAKKLNGARYTLKLFLDTFGLEAASLATPSDMIGGEGWAILGLEESDQWGEQNFIKKFIAPK
jgi:hypothetical protein